MGSPYWIRYLINKTFSQRFFWSKLSRMPGLGRLIEYALFEDDEIIYLPRDKAVLINKTIKRPDDMVIPSTVVNHFIESSSFRFKMDFCICRDSNQCKDYPSDLGCLFIGKAAREINPKFGRSVTKTEAKEHVQKCRDAGLVHLIGRNKLDSVWLNVGPVDKLLTICNCCPCCCLWKILPVVNSRINAKVRRMPGVSVRVTSKCAGCRKCTENVCFVNAITMVDNKAVINGECRGCGQCVQVCPAKAIEIDFGGLQSTEMAVKLLETHVDVG